MNQESSRTWLSGWLLLGVVMIFIQVMLGGITRLTGSGLSITEWDLILGAIPPTSQEKWNEAFELYKAYPQYELINKGMSLQEFKWIYFWEYVHRLWGRILGLVFAVPLVFFGVKRIIKPRELPKYAAILVLGGAQGVMGWIMVKSGLVDMPWVDPAKLTAHLLLAMALFILVYHLYLDVREPGVRRTSGGKGALTALNILLVLLVLQVSLGGFVAGWKAAVPYPTWPKMGDEWIPSSLFVLEPVWKNFFSNKATVQFFHRLMAYVILIYVLVFYWRTRMLDKESAFMSSRKWMLALVGLQVLLGIITVVNSRGSVPVVWGVMHQLTAFLLILSVVKSRHTLRGV